MRLADRVAARSASKRDVSRAADPVTMEEFGYLLGQSRGGSSRSTAGVSVSSRRVLGIPGWYRGVSYVTNAVSFLPWKHYRDDAVGRTLRAAPPWLKMPDGDMAWPFLVEHWMMSMLHRGNAYAFKLRDPMTEQVAGLRALHPDRIKSVGRDPQSGVKVFEVRDGDRLLAFTSREILHIPGLSSDGVIGIDPISYMADAFGIAIASDEFAARSFNGSHLRSYLSVPEVLTVDEARRVKEQWQEAHAGVTSAAGFGVLSGGAEYKTLSLTPEQVQLLDTRRFNVLDMARIVGCPPHKMYDLDRATFSNIEHQSIESTTDSIRPWVQRIETCIDSDPDLTPEGNFTEANLDGLLRGDALSVATSLKMGIDGGWLSPKSAAEIQNLPAPDELGYYLRPLNMAVIQPGVEQPSAPDPDPVAARSEMPVINVDARTMVEPSVINVDARTTVEPSVINIPEQQSPIVNVERSDVHVAAPVVNVEPVFNVPTPERTATRKTIERNADGQITAVIEETE